MPKKDPCAFDYSTIESNLFPFIPLSGTELGDLQRTNVAGLAGLTAKCGLVRLKGPKIPGGGDGNRIANYLNSLFNDLNAPAYIKDMIKEAKKSGNLILGVPDPNNVGVYVRFFENTNPDKTGSAGTGVNPYNFYFNLDITDLTSFPPMTSYNHKEIVTVTFHTDLHPTKGNFRGAFHVRDKSVGTLPDGTEYIKSNNSIRLRICPDAAGNIDIDRVYKNKKTTDINFNLVNPFLDYFILVFKHYLNNGCVLPPYVPFPAPAPPPPPPAPAPAPSSPPTPPAPSLGPTNPNAVNSTVVANAAANTVNSTLNTNNAEAEASKLGLNPTAKEFVPGSGGKRIKKRTKKNKNAKIKTRKSKRR